MGFIIWYKLTIEAGGAGGGLLASAAALLGAGLPVTLSNDVYSGQHILDADITLTMPAGASVSSFEIRLLNLPSDVADMLKSQQAAAQPNAPLRVKIFLDYFENLPALTARDPVMVGAILNITNEINEQGLLETRIKGEELGGYMLRIKRNSQHSQPDQITAEALLRQILQDTGVELVGSHGLTPADQLRNYTITAPTALRALAQLADRLRAPLVIRDNNVYLKNAVGSGPPVDTLSADDSIVKLSDRQERQGKRDQPAADANSFARDAARTVLEATVLGNPKLHVGQTVLVRRKETQELRITYLVHRYSSSSGFTSDLILVAAEPGELVEGTSGAYQVAQRLQDLVENAKQTVIDVGQINAYSSGVEGAHLATLDYGQSPALDATAPSVETPVETATQLHNKPIASPFAFHKTGLIVPVYPGMRALLAHNRSLVNDAIVTGFLWSEEPKMEPPANEPGDYWLSLPTELDSEGLPTGKSVNDLTDSAGRRAIQAKGLHILVGEDKLPEVGVRPQMPDDLDKQIVIEHASGTTITIDGNGAVRIETSSQEIAMTNGSVTLKLNGPAVEVS
jgi:hypothetical protein